MQCKLCGAPVRPNCDGDIKYDPPQTRSVIQEAARPDVEGLIAKLEERISDTRLSPHWRLGLRAALGLTKEHFAAGAGVEEKECIWVIHFDDADMKPEIFMHYGAKEAALKRFEHLSTNWNCNLFKQYFPGQSPEPQENTRAKQMSEEERRIAVECAWSEEGWKPWAYGGAADNGEIVYREIRDYYSKRSMGQIVQKSIAALGTLP